MAKSQNQYGVVWKKRILVPFWVIRILLMLVCIAIYAIAIRVLQTNRDALSDLDLEEAYAPALAIIIVFMLLMVAVLLMDILAIILFLRDRLNPKVFLILNTIQTAFWTIVLLLDLVAIGRGASAVGMGFTVIIFLSFVALLIYASINCHRSRKQAKRGHYAAAHNPAAPPAPYMGSTPYQTHNTAYAGGDVELNTHASNPYQSHGAASDYYVAQPTKPAQVV